MDSAVFMVLSIFFYFLPKSLKGSIIISEIGNINRFSSPAKLLAFSGLEPTIYQSGQYSATRSRMVKRGSSYLRWALMQASRTICLTDKTFKDYLAKKRTEGKHYLVALSHVARKLVRVIFYLLKSNKEFIPQHWGPAPREAFYSHKK